MLGIRTYPMNWPIGNGREFRGVFDGASRKVLAFEGDGRANGTKKVDEVEATLGDAALSELIGEHNHNNLMDDIELLDGADSEFDLDAVLTGKLAPAVSRLRPHQLSAWSPSSQGLPASGPRPRRAYRRAHRRARGAHARTSPASSSRSRRTWTRTIATESPSCASAPSSSAAWRQRTCRAVGRSNSPRVRP